MDTYFYNSIYIKEKEIAWLSILFFFIKIIVWSNMKSYILL
jgi:hypothetical protein